MILSELLDQWTDLGIILWEDDGRLRYRAPRGVVTSDVISQLRANKEDILVRLRERSGPRARPEDRFESFPLTDVQGAYLMGRSSVFDYGGVACHLYCEVNYPGLDPARAIAAWRTLVDRHDMLRVEIDASGFQRVRREVPPLEIPVVTLASSAPKEREMRLEQVRERLSHSVHPTGSWPMFAIEFTQPPADEPDGRSTMHISFDFLVGDWVSLLRLIREWEQEYAGREAPVGSLLQFRDYVLWETAQREGQSHRRARDYWLDRIDDLPPAPQLPIRDGALDPSAAASPVRWRGHSFLMPRAQWQQLERHAREHELTASAAVLTCYADVLSRWAEDPHFCLNLTVLDRPSDVPELARVIGDFTSVTLLETLADTRPFNVRARELLEQLFTDLDHRSFSGVEVMREIARRRGRDAAVMPYVYTSAIGVGADDQDVASTVHGSMGYTISQTPQAFLDCQVMDDIDGLHVHWDAREGIFPAGMLDDMFTAFTDALRRLAADGGSWSTASPVELPAEQRVERERANATQRDLPTGLLHEFVIEAARTSPAAMAVLGLGVNISYTDLLKRSATIATALKNAGVQRGDRVAIAMPKSPDQVAAVLGVLISGAAYVPLDIRHPRARLAAICDDAGVVALVCAEGHEVAEGVPVIDVAELPDAGPGTVPPAICPDAEPGDLAYVIYTSGSTGRPKGVEISHRAAVNTIMDVNERFRLTGNDRTLAIADLGFDLSVYDIFGPLSVGGAVVLPPADTIVTPSTWLEVAAEYGVTTLNTVPAVAQLLLTALDNGGARPGAFRQWILSGDRVPPDLVRDLQKAFPNTQFVSMGGATEAAIWSIAHPIAPVQPSTISIPYGLPLANQRFAVLDTLGRDVPTGVPGELVIMGTGLADGYSNAPELTARSFVEDSLRGRMYHTGDLGFYLPGGEIEILGRLDDQIKIRGHRIELGEVESILAEHGAVAQAAVVVIGNGSQRRLHAFVVPTEATGDEDVQPAEDTTGGVATSPVVDSALEPERFAVCAGDTASLHENLASFLSGRLPGVMVPQQFDFVPELPLTRNGKIDKKKLTVRAEASEEMTGRGECDTADTAGSTLPESAETLAARITDLWAEQLGLGESPAHGANPFDLGANSISAAAVAGRLRDEIPEFAEASFETVLRVLLSAPSIGAAAVEYDDWARGRVPGQSDRSVVEITPLRDSGENRATASRVTVLFSDSLANSMTMTQLAAALPPDAGAIVAVTIPDDEWFTSRPADTVTDAIADLVAAAAADMEAEEYCLIGYSYGALVAIETARRLLEAGQNVLPLGLIDPQIVPVMADDRLSEVMFLTSRGASLDTVVPRGEKPPELIEIFNWISSRARSASFSTHRVPDLTSRTTGTDADTETPVGRFFGHLASLDEQERWRVYRDAIPAEQHATPERLRQEWLRYRHTMRAATLAPEPLVSDAVIIQPRSSHGFLPGAHERSLQLWQDVFIGTGAITHVNGNHFTMLDGDHVVDTAGVLIGELTALGVFPPR